MKSWNISNFMWKLKYFNFHFSSQWAKVCTNRLILMLNSITQEGTRDCDKNFKSKF